MNGLEHRILLISHNPLGKQNNMARTLENQFSGVKTCNIAQLYFSEDIPDSDFCKSFFGIPDLAVLKSVFTRNPAGAEVAANGVKSPETKRKPSGLKQKISRIAGYRAPFTVLSRNLIWKLGKWKSGELLSWVDRFNPEVIYYASGEYAFSYKVAYYIAKKRNIPVILGCYDDFYQNRKKPYNLLYRYNRKNLLKWAQRILSLGGTFTAISEMMTRDYSVMFNCHGVTLSNPTRLKSLPDTERKSIIYVGNVDYGRAEQLITLGKTVKKLGIPDFDRIDIYSGEQRREITDRFNEENGICFHGKVPADEVTRLLLKSKYVIHTESFNEAFRKRVKYSVSTKISDCLASGACIIAFGPSDIASVEYLKNEQAACIITDENSLEEKLKELFNSEEQRKRLVSNAYNTAAKYHDPEKIYASLNNLINSVAENTNKI